ncbi:cellulase family glycosylhydrolase [bacterium]|nr:cellulase family glycosylhydrolase [bacterium]
MKHERTLQLIMALLLPAACFQSAGAQSLVTFSATRRGTDRAVELDSILVQNRTRCVDTVITTPSFDLDRHSGLPDMPWSVKPVFSIARNHPNGFSGETGFEIGVPNAETVSLAVYNILGQKLAGTEKNLPEGYHHFTLRSGDWAAGIYLISVRHGNDSRTLKILKTGPSAGDTAGFRYNGAVSPCDRQPAKVSNPGDAYRFIGFAGVFKNDTLDSVIPAAGDHFTFEFEPRIGSPEIWKGFNLLGKFTVEWSNKGYDEEDFDMISELGFNFVRLPIDYRTYTKAGDWNTFVESGLMDIDHAVEWGQAYGIHVCINLHRAPGYCINPPGSALPASQNVSLWTNTSAQEAFVRHWDMFSRRYAQVPASDLSFNLVNEPYGVDDQAYIRVMKSAIEAIRAVTPERMILSDMVHSLEPIPEFVPLDIIQSPHFYEPMQITHYKADWVSGSDSWDEPEWPILPVPQYIYGPSKIPWNTPLVLHGSFPAGTRVDINVLQVSSRIDLVVRADSKVIFQKSFIPGPGEGEWKQVIYSEQWNIYQNIYDRTYSGNVEQDASEISFRAAAGDWMTFSEIRIVPPAGSGLRGVRMKPGLGWGLPQTAYTVSNDGLVAVETIPAGFESSFDIEAWLNPWIEVMDKGSVVFAGEWGVFSYTPHDVTLAFMEDRLKAMQDAGIGWALWNFRGGFGPLDSGRSDVNYEAYRGHQMDKKMMDLLQKY